MEKINPSDIIKGHIKTLYDYGTKKQSLIDYLTYYIFPVILSYFFLYFFSEVGSALANSLISVFSIFIGLLLNLLVLIYDLVKKTVDTWKGTPTKELGFKLGFLEEIFATISYCILISVFAIFFLLSSLIQISVIQYICGFFIYFLTIHFFLTILIVLGRTHALFFKEFAETRKNIEIEQAQSHFLRNSAVLMILVLISVLIWATTNQHPRQYLRQQIERIRQ